MKIKEKDLSKRVITEVKIIDLSDLYVKKIPEGKKREVLVPMNVGEFIEYLSSFDMNGIMEYSRGYYGEDGSLTVTITREETDEEYNTRLETIKIINERKKKKEAERQRKAARKNEELETLKKLAKKYNVKIEEKGLT